MEVPGQTANRCNEASQEDFELSCYPCSTDGHELHAAGFCVDCQHYLCETCYKYHCRALPMRSHVLLDKTDMPEQKMPAMTKVGDEKCPQHEGKSIKYFCKSHNRLGCSVCMTTGHRRCEDVDYIADISKGIEDSTEYKEFTIKLTTIEEHCTQNKSKANEGISQSRACYANAIEDIRKLREEMNTMLDGLINKIEKEAKCTKDEDIDKMNTISEKCDRAIHEIQTLNSDMEMLRQSHQDQQLFIKMKNALENIKTFEDSLAKVTRANNTRQYMFVPAEEVMNILSSMKVFGKLKPINPGDYKAVHVNDINVKLSSDKQSCWVSGSTIMSDGRLAITDFRNRNVKLINTQQNKVTSQMSSYPFNIVESKTNEAAVTLPNERLIQFVSISDTLSQGRRVKVAGICWGIACIKDRLAVTFEEPPKVEIMTMDGTVLNVISTYANGSQLFKCPLSIAVSPDLNTMHVSDRDNYLTSLTFDGKVTATYTDKDLNTTTGVCIDRDGNIYVCGRNSNNVHQLTAGCDKVQVLLKSRNGVDLPCSVAYSDQGDTIYLGMQYNNNVKVFQLQNV